MVSNEGLNFPIANAGEDGQLTCIDLEINLDGTGSSEGVNFTYSWSTQNGRIVSGEDSLFPVVDKEGEYVLEVTNSQNTCTSTDAVMVGKASDPTVSISPGSSIQVCEGESTVLEAMGADTYLWEWDEGSSTATGDTLTVMDAGIYTVTGMVTETGCEDDAQSTVTVVQKPEITVNDTSLTIKSGGNVAFDWEVDPPFGFVSWAITQLNNIDTERSSFDETGNEPPNASFFLADERTIGQVIYTLTGTNEECVGEMKGVHITIFPDVAHFHP